MIELNKVYNESNLETMARMPSGFIDLTVTSPPYDNLREYKGFSFPFKDIAKELFRVTKEGGVLVWIVGDATINGSESLTSFKQAIFFNELGFNLHDTMIYKKVNSLPMNHNRYEQDFEYMFVFSKGKPKTFNPIIVPTTWREKRDSVTNRANPNEKNSRLRHGAKRLDTKPTKIKGNIWDYKTGLYHSSSDRIAFEHPAIFPESLVNDHIVSWSNEGEIVYDPFLGSGTTAKMAIALNRQWVGSEISKEYVSIINKRVFEKGVQVFLSGV